MSDPELELAQLRLELSIAEMAMGTDRVALMNIRMKTPPATPSEIDQAEKMLAESTSKVEALQKRVKELE